MNKSADFILGDNSIVVEVERVESFVDVEAGLSLQSLADRLSRGLGLEVDSPHVSELNLGVAHEAVVSSVAGAAVVG